MDPELVKVWADWDGWGGNGFGHSQVDEMMPEEALVSLQAHLAEHGFAIVRRMDPDLPG